MTQTFRKLVLAMASIAGLGTTAQAAVIPYRMTMMVTMASTSDCEGKLAMNLRFTPDAKHFGCGWKAGDVIFGDFSLVEDAAQLANGVHRLNLDYFSVAIGTVAFDVANPDFHTRGVFGDCPSSPDPRADTYFPLGPSMRALVKGGLVTGFCDSVRGPGGFPALQFNEGNIFSNGSPAFIAFDVFSGVSMFGKVTVSQISEPGSLALAGAAVFGAVAMRRRRSSAQLQLV